MSYFLSTLPVFVFPSDFAWSDLGTWHSLFCHMQKGNNNNVSIASEVHFAESHNCIVDARQMKKVLLVGVDDCVVAENDGNLLVCRMSEENRIKYFTDIK